MSYECAVCGKGNLISDSDVGWTSLSSGEGYAHWRCVGYKSELNKQIAGAFDSAEKMEPTFKSMEIAVVNGHKVPFYTWIKISDSPSAALQFCVNGKPIGLLRYLFLVAEWRVLRMFRVTK